MTWGMNLGFLAGPARNAYCKAVLPPWRYAPMRWVWIEAATVLLETGLVQFCGLRKTTIGLQENYEFGSKVRKLIQSRGARRALSAENNSKLCMASELTRTAIRTMRVKELRQELESRGLDCTGLRPILQARLLEGAASESPRRRPTTARSQQHANDTSDETLGTKKRSQQQRDSHTLGATADLAEQPSTLYFLPEDAETGDEEGSSMRSPGTDGGLRASPAREDVGSPPTSLQPLRAFPREALDHMFVLQFDGGSRGNPGNSGAGAAISRLDGGQRKEVFCGFYWVGPVATNNEAEYHALIEGLRAAKELGIKNLTVQGDSRLVIQQMRLVYKVKSPKMRAKWQEAQKLVDAFNSTFMHIPREENSRADKLANMAMNSRESSRHAVDWELSDSMGTFSG